MAYNHSPHPYLHAAVLFISGLNPDVSDADLAKAFETCVPMRPLIHRDGSRNPLSGTIEFKAIESAEKALATLQSRQIHSPPSILLLSPFPPHPPTVLPPPQATPRLVKHLPSGITDSELYDLFRPFGPLASVRTHTGFGTQDSAVVEYWREDDARLADESMHCADVGGSNISVTLYQPQASSRRSLGGASSGQEFEMNTAAPPFIPTAVSHYAYPPSPHSGHGRSHSLSGSVGSPSPYTPPRQMSYGLGNRSPTQGSPFLHGPGQQVQFAPLVGPGSTSQSGLIDPCNLFCKNLDPAIDSNELFTAFRQFGQIVSARVMRTDSGQSRGFGFVSFQSPDQAANAMHTMNGQTIGSKQIIVRLHEPKQLRQEKLAQRFSQGSPGHPRSASGATSPTQSEGGEGVIWNERTRRSSGSYYHAALTGNLNFPMQFDELTALSPVVRTEVLTGELSRRLKSLDHPSIPTDEVDQIVDSLVKLNLGDIVEGIHNPDRLAEQIKIARERISGSGPGDVSKTADSSPESGSGSGLLDPSLLSAPAPSSAPEHPSTPISISGSLSTPPRTSSPSGSLTASASERDRLQAAVAKLDPTLDSSKLGDITDLLLTLSKKERALCLFNAEYLRPKIADAKKVLEANDDKSGDNLTLGSTPLRPPVLSKAASAPAVPFTPKGKSNDSPFESPRTPELSSRGQSAAASPSFPPTPGLSTITSATQYTLASLAKLPAVDIIKLAESPSSSNLITGLPLPKPGPSIVQATDAYVDSLLTKPVTGQKQVLGEKLFKLIKTYGIKNAPKITIYLLDSEDLRALTHLMESYPEVLREKVSQVARQHFPSGAVKSS